MKALNEKFAKIDAMSVRERIILFLLLLAGTWTAIDFLLLSPQNAAHEAEQKKHASANTTLSAAEQTLALLANQPDPNQEVLQRRDRALNALNSRLQNAANLQARMVQPKDQATILQAMLSGHSSLRLTGL
jgi:exopolyphosphatase/pppGpp-phosphohydrolase